MTVATAEQVLDFWFGELDADGSASQDRAQRWWRKSSDFDAEIRNKFTDTHAAIAARLHEEWLGTPRTRLAYVIVLDQFSRNMFRDAAKMYASDQQAIDAVLSGIEIGADAELRTDERVFFYMPLMHSEDIAVQDRCVTLFDGLADEVPDSCRDRIRSNHGYAVQHRDIVARFNRFPHRNEILDRDCTDEELAFLKEPGSSF